jgi:hypothetical protein
MSQRRQTVFLWALIVVAVALSAWYYVQNIPPPLGEYDAFAKCIASTTTKFYGAFWCPHCEAQKAEFGDASKYLPYTECSTPDALGELQTCKDIGIKEYPTWFFPDGSSSTGEQTLPTLSQKTSCPLPANS